MDRTERYRDVLTRLVREYEESAPNDGIRTIAVVDREGDHYQVMNVGWDGKQRTHYCSLHLDIIGGKVWLQLNRTDQRVDRDLMAAGVPREDIVLAFHPEYMRQHTGFAVK